MGLSKTPAIVLKSRKWGDADRIVTFFTLKHGKVRGVAHGARRMKSRFGSALEPFVHCDLDLFEKQGDSLYRISQASIRQSFYTLRDSLETITGAARLATLAGAVTADGDAVPRVFHALLEGFRAIGQSEDAATTAALYELEILRFAGYLPHLERCNSCQSTATDRWFFSPRAGGTLCGPCARHEPVRCALISPASLAFFRQALRMDPALLPRLKATAPVREELRDAIELYVDYVAGRSLPKSGALFAAERRSTYRRTPSPVASGNANRV